ncbi:MAG: FHA domain-containing protein [Sedimentisphaerales bacterium]|nr:FHA domain-containing protein [Sedimentisphaerales bacterium]
MRLVVKKADSVISEMQFGSGPINIGRHADSQVFLPDRTVSRYHAVIYSTQDGEWIVEDLDSANKTHLNGEAVHKAPIKSGDILKIVDFIIEINLEDETIAGEPINLDDTLTTTVSETAESKPKDPYEPKIIVRRTDTGRAPDIKLPITRTAAFAQATEAICKAKGIEDVLKVLISVISRQFKAHNIWAALRNEPQGPMIVHAGKSLEGKNVKLEQLRLKDKINQVIEKQQFLLIPRIPQRQGESQINSAIIAPVMGQGGCFGVIYLDNDMAHERYDISDLDYLMLLAIHTSTIVENF